jgi:UDP-glucose 4-epimerase
MRVLVTGAGLIATEVASLLAARGDTCVLYDVAPAAGAGHVQGDVTDQAALTAAARAFGAEAIVHTAALLSDALRADPVRGLQVNLLGTAAVLEAARRLALRRVVLCGSLTVLYPGFSTFGPAPIPEDAALHLLSQRPGSLYALTKLAGEQMGLIWRDRYGVDAVTLRLAAVLGDRPGPATSVPGRLFRRLVAAARAGGECVLDDPLLVWDGPEEFVDARDGAGAILAALDAARPAQGVYNIAHPRLWTLEDAAAAVAAAAGPFRLVRAAGGGTGFAGFPHIRPAPSSTDAALRELGFACRHDLTDSLHHWWCPPPGGDDPA